MHSQLNHIVAKQEHARIIRSAEARARTANLNASRSVRPSTKAVKQLRRRINAAFSPAVRGSARDSL